jgi:hypothetical protein
MTAGGVAGAEAATAAGASGAGAMNGPPCGQDTDCESGKHCVGSQPADVCVRDEDWTCSIWNDCTWSDSCSRLDHKCHLARQLGESCSDDYRCVFPVLCDGVCTAPDEVDPDIWACASNGCELGTFCRYYPATSGADCWDIRTDFEGWPCASADFNCGPLFTCVSGECKARATTYPSCASSETVCNVHSFCDHSRGVTCRPRRFAGENCQNEPAACELGAFCNSQGRCQDYPAEGQPCDAGRCVVSMKCGTQLAGGVCAPD